MAAEVGHGGNISSRLSIGKRSKKRQGGITEGG